MRSRELAIYASGGGGSVVTRWCSRQCSLSIESARTRPPFVNWAGAYRSSLHPPHLPLHPAPLAQSQKYRTFFNRASRHSYSGKLRTECVIRFRNFRRLDVRRKIIELDDVWVRNGKVIDPERRFWEASKGNEFYADKTIDGKGLILSPGFIDIQLNGAFGIDFTSPTLTADEVSTVSRGILSQGCTSYLPTIITSNAALYTRNLPLLVDPPASAGDLGAEILGVHLEGPFIQIKGAHNELYLRDFERSVESLNEVYGSEAQCENVRLVTLAPEIPNALEVVAHLAKKGVVVSLGHSKATVDEAEAAVTAGATLVTHMFNAMRSFHHRDPGIVGLLGGKYGGTYVAGGAGVDGSGGSSSSGASRSSSTSASASASASAPKRRKRPRSHSTGALESANTTSRSRVFYSIIPDGIHCHPYSLTVAHKTHPDGLVIIR